METTLKYNHDNYSDYNYDSYSDYKYSLYWFNPPTPLGTQPPPLWFLYGWVMVGLWFPYGSLMVGLWLGYGWVNLGLTFP